MLCPNHASALRSLGSGALGALMAALLFAEDVKAADAGAYIEARIGVASATGAAVPQPASVALDVDAESGAAFSGAVGYRFEGPFRVEFDLTHQRNSFAGAYEEKIQILIFPPCGFANRPCLGPRVTGRIKAPAAMMMAFYDLDLAARWQLSIGAGAGLVDYGVRVDTRAGFLDGTSRPFTIVDAENTLVGGRAAVGLSYEIGRTAFVARYAYTRTERTAIAGAGNLAFRYNQNMSGHGFTAGVRYGF